VIAVAVTRLLQSLSRPPGGRSFSIAPPERWADEEDGCVWACSHEGREVWCRSLGPVEKVAEVTSQWLGSIERQERS
jgi:hypothetical protein